MAEAIAVVGLVIGAASAVSSRRQAKRARKSQEKALKATANIADLENARARRKQIVEARRRRAQVIQQGESAGISGGSQVAGAAGSIQSQAASNVSFLNQLQGFDQNRLANLSDANTALGKAATFQAVGQAGLQVAGSSQNIANLFGSSK